MKSGFLNNAQMKKKKPSGAQKRKKKKEQEELVADVERLKLGPTPLWKFVVDHPDIFEAHVLLSGKLNGTDIKMFYECCRASRRAVKRAKIKVQERFMVPELSSISTLELAWEGYPWGARIRWPDGEVITQNQEYFCSGVALTNDLKLLRWVREEKECAWDLKTSVVAASNGNLDMLKYCCENGCDVDARHCAVAAEYGHLACLEYLRSKNFPWDKRVCKEAHENNHIDIFTYAVKKKCPGFEAYEQYIPTK
jgi:hypothetical protein